MYIDSSIFKFPASHEIVDPPEQTAPLVFSSPHSGSSYPPEFVASSRLDPVTLRRSEDSFVDEIFGAAPACGSPLLRALFPRAYVDVNREPFELDPTMFDEQLPSYVNTKSPRIAAGLGTIARVVANGTDIYSRKLTFAEAENRIRNCYRPYHEALKSLVRRTRERFGFCILIDCHSMPSALAVNGTAAGTSPLDFVLGDHFGESCSAVVTETVAATLRRLGYRVGFNKPYSGGFITTNYGQPDENVHALQIEISRKIYMDEARVHRGPRLPGLTAEMRQVIEALARIDGRILTSATPVL